jgi:hypothetical protein
VEELELISSFFSLESALINEIREGERVEELEETEGRIRTPELEELEKL